MNPTNDSIREEFDRFWEIEKHNNGPLSPRQSDRISDWWLSKKEEWEIGARESERKSLAQAITHLGRNETAEVKKTLASVLSLLQTNHKEK